jgi:hypothetical protein
MTHPRSSRLLLSPLLLLVALLTTLGLNASSATASVGPQTRVRALDTPTATVVGPATAETPASVGCLRLSQPGLASGSCVATDAARFAVDSTGNATMFVNRGGEMIGVSPHAARRMTQRGISIDAVESTLSHPSFHYFHQGVWKTGYYDPVARTFVGTVDDTVTTVIHNASPNYIQNLQAATP